MKAALQRHAALEARLAQSKAQLKALLGDIESKPDDLPCADNARKVLSRMLLGSQDAGEVPGLPLISGWTA